MHFLTSRTSFGRQLPTAERGVRPRGPARAPAMRVVAFKDAATVKQQESDHMRESVHDFFHAISRGSGDRRLDQEQLACLLSEGAVLWDRIGGAARVTRTTGAQAIQQRLAALHHAVPGATTWEVADVVDSDKHTLCASWVCCSGPPQQQQQQQRQQQQAGDGAGATATIIHGTYVFAFDPLGRITSVTHHLDTDEDLDA